VLEERWREGKKRWEKEEEDISSFCMTLSEREDAGN